MVDNVKNDNEQLTGEELGPCPFCGKEIAYGISAIDGVPDSLLHELPMCPKFETMAADEFATAMREEMERQQRS